MLAAFYDGGDFYHFLKGKVAGDLAFSPVISLIPFQISPLI